MTAKCHHIKAYKIAKKNNENPINEWAKSMKKKQVAKQIQNKCQTSLVIKRGSLLSLTGIFKISNKRKRCQNCHQNFINDWEYNQNSKHNCSYDYD
jgi:hypothetical protein